MKREYLQRLLRDTETELGGQIGKKSFAQALDEDTYRLMSSLRQTLDLVLSRVYLGLERTVKSDRAHESRQGNIVRKKRVESGSVSSLEPGNYLLESGVIYKVSKNALRKAPAKRKSQKSSFRSGAGIGSRSSPILISKERGETGKWKSLFSGETLVQGKPEKSMKKKSLKKFMNSPPLTPVAEPSGLMDIEESLSCSSTTSTDGLNSVLCLGCLTDTPCDCLLREALLSADLEEFTSLATSPLENGIIGLNSENECVEPLIEELPKLFNLEM